MTGSLYNAITLWTGPSVFYHSSDVGQQVRTSLPTPAIHLSPQSRMTYLNSFLQFWLSNEKETNSLSRTLCSQHFAPSSCQCGCLLVLMLTGVNWHGSINMWLGEVKRWFEEKKLREIDSLRVWCVGFDMTVSILQRKGVSRGSFFADILPVSYGVFAPDFTVKLSFVRLCFFWIDSFYNASSISSLCASFCVIKG